MTALQVLTRRSKIKSHVTKDQNSKHKKLVHETEVHAYAYILKQLTEKRLEKK